MSSYSNYHKKYYETNKEEILTKNKENNYWKTYYENNKEKIKEKAKLRYQSKKEKLTIVE
jgi:hypothetical protein